MFTASSFKSKKIIVTGAGRGIGRSIATKMHSCGAIVYAISKTLNNLLSLKKECPTIQIIQVDLCDWNATREAVQKIGPVDGLVNNAAILGPQSFLNVTADNFEQVMKVNIGAVINVSQIVAQDMIKANKGGSIVNISTVAAIGAFTFITPYSVSKAGLEILTRIMAVELGPHKIRVNGISPGLTTINGVLTDMAIECQAAGSASIGVGLHAFVDTFFSAKSPIGKGTVDVEDIINTTLFLLSGLADSMTGRCIVLDNGVRL